jgi:hydrogenase expression/formation protein HypC
MCLAIPGRLESRRELNPLTPEGTVRFGGVTRAVTLTFVPEAMVGDHVLVHAGVAIAVINEAEAERILRALDELGATEEEEFDAPPEGLDAPKEGS